MEVNYEGALKFENLERLSFYINKSGGFKNADKEAIYVLHPNGDTQRASIKRVYFKITHQMI